MRITTLLAALCIASLSLAAQKTYKLASPDAKVETTITAGTTLAYSISVDGKQVLAPSALSMTLSNNSVWGTNVKVKKADRSTINEAVPSPVYRATALPNHCNVLTLQCAGNYNVEFRAYNNGVAYRFVSRLKKPFNVNSEGVEYNLVGDCTCVVPYVNGFDANNPEGQFRNSFENTYTISPVSKLNPNR